VDVTLVQYNTTVANADLDLADHTRMDPVPAEIAVRSFLVVRRRSKQRQERCWDVTLVDAPQGIAAAQRNLPFA
jgi:hypothetical protein